MLAVSIYCTALVFVFEDGVNQENTFYRTLINADERGFCFVRLIRFCPLSSPQTT
jgi:hypothetical protein